MSAQQRTSATIAAELAVARAALSRLEREVPPLEKRFAELTAAQQKADQAAQSAFVAREHLAQRLPESEADYRRACEVFADRQRELQEANQDLGKLAHGAQNPAALRIRLNTMLSEVPRLEAELAATTAREDRYHADLAARRKAAGRG